MQYIRYFGSECTAEIRDKPRN